MSTNRFRRSLEYDIDPDEDIMVLKEKIRLSLPFLGVAGNKDEIATQANEITVDLIKLCHAQEIIPRHFKLVNEEYPKPPTIVKTVVIK